MRHLVPDTTIQTTRSRALPPPLTSDNPDSFAWSVIHRRHPLLIEQARAAHPYGPQQVDGLEALAAEMTGGLVRPLKPESHDGHAWQGWSESYVGRRWDEVPFLWSESYFYRRLLEAIEFFSPGPWYWNDPFAHLKSAELAHPTLAAELAALDRLADLDPQQRGRALLLAALWGNRADLGFAVHAARPDLAVSESLIVDDSDHLWSLLTKGAGTVCLVADNAGRELLADLILVDELLESGLVGDVVIHVKPIPYYVSDAMTSDVTACVQRLASAGGYAAVAARRLQDSFRRGRIRLRTSWFYSAPFEFDAMPADLHTEFANAALTIMKGDLNYRRLFGDRAWPATTEVSIAGAYFPGPFAALRTLKSDVVIGVSEDRLKELEAHSSAWRVTGTHAMVQVMA